MDIVRLLILNAGLSGRPVHARNQVLSKAHAVAREAVEFDQ